VTLKNEIDVLDLIAADQQMLAVLGAVDRLGLPDCWVGAGFVRAKVWDHLSRLTAPTALNDIDVIYFEPKDLSTTPEAMAEKALSAALPGLPWSVKNQARMHLRNKEAAYRSTAHALEFWLETPTAVAVRLDISGKLQLLAPFGIQDLLAMTIRPTPKARSTPERLQEYQDRLRKKNWAEQWPMLTIVWS
jgi:hypothetical protein